MIFPGMASMFQEYAQWWICGVIAVLGIVIYGFKDLIRLSIGRVWAISGVCFAESVRRKIWLITPLAIVGVIVVAQLQRPLDERDAIRQTIKFSLFPNDMQVYSRLPDPKGERRYTYGTGESDIIVPFEMKPADLIPAGVAPGMDAPPGMAGLLVSLRMGADRIPGYVDEETAPSLPP